MMWKSSAEHVEREISVEWYEMKENELIDEGVDP
jgi:hypothetical protein